MSLLAYDPTPWLMTQDGVAAVRARRILDLHREGDENIVRLVQRKLLEAQLLDGSFEHSLTKTAGVLKLLDDLKTPKSEALIQKASLYLLSVLEAQPGYERAKGVTPGSLKTPCDLCGFFGPYKARNQLEILALGTKEMNFYREFEPLLGPKSPIRASRRSNLDRPGPSSCYSWGLIPLCYTIEALCRAGHGEDSRLKPAINVLLGAQRESGGWCRNLAGHPNCTIHAVRVLASHPQLKHSEYAEKALRFMWKTQQPLDDSQSRWWRGSNVFATIQAIAEWNTPVARRIICPAILDLAKRQRRNGTWLGPNRIELVAAVLYASHHMV